MRICLLVLLLNLAAENVLALPVGTESKDSTSKFKFHILCSVHPITKWVSGGDSIDNFMYSHSLLEFQTSYKRHNLYLGFNYDHKKLRDVIHDVPVHHNHWKKSFMPAYSFMAASKGKWRFYTGLGYVINVRTDKEETMSPLEIITKNDIYTEEGLSVFFRFNYDLGKHFSLEIESAFYNTRGRYDHRENYPLTPSLNEDASEYSENQTFPFPSNIYIKYSF